MRENERHLVEVPRKQLSRLSHLVVEFRQDRYKLQNRKGIFKFHDAMRKFKTATDRDAELEAYGEVYSAIADLIMNAVYPE